ncbi:hypothetical protein T12_1301 [Trichinella patagoniensis]|uniref:Uncharacterized protein n=1 Tax=Trichinella patagoniensis TaxID=990121 RepID=A0A0V0Z465_9BILA|nr:hypothetical protein T12_4161 [Trichinella patagoniensis]KRY11558.1 hypothetical protein T12_1301 [Trichinella patagoniensis]
MGWVCSEGSVIGGSWHILTDQWGSLLRISSVKRKLGNKGQQERQQPYGQYDHGDETTGRLTFPCQWSMITKTSMFQLCFTTKKRRS